MFTRALVALLTLLPAVAGATPAPNRAHATLGGPFIVGELQAQVTEGEIALRCDDEMLCAVEATWELAVAPEDPDGPGERWLVGEIPAGHLTVTDLTCCRADGRCDGCALEVAPAATRDPWEAAPGPNLPTVRFQAPARAGEQIRVVLRGEIATPPNRDWTSWAMTPVRTRHMLLGSDDQATVWRVVLEPPRSLRPGAVIVATAEVPDGLEIAPGWTREGALVSATAGESAAELRTTRPAPVAVHGGPLIGIGARVNGEIAARARLGYEFAAPPWLLYALAVETDFTDRALIVPTVEAALPFVLLLPSLGFGLGAPVHIDGDGARVGVRLQTSLAFPFVSVVVPFDIYPSLDVNDPDFWQAAVMAQASF